jgi:hypothetical protein
MQRNSRGRSFVDEPLKIQKLKEVLPLGGIRKAPEKAGRLLSREICTP